MVKALDFTRRLLVRIQPHLELIDSEYGECSSEVERWIVAPEGEIAKFSIYPNKKISKNLGIKNILYIFAKQK